MPVIRRSAEEDAPGIAALVAGSWRRTYSPLLDEERAGSSSDTRHRSEIFLGEVGDRQVASFVAVERDGAIVGHAMAQLRADGEVWLERLHVDPAHFGTGLAADLLHASIAAFVGGAGVMALEVPEGNDRAIAFYRKQGFETTERKNVCGGLDGVPTLIMKRVIARA